MPSAAPSGRRARTPSCSTATSVRHLEWLDARIGRPSVEGRPCPSRRLNRSSQRTSPVGYAQATRRDLAGAQLLGEVGQHPPGGAFGLWGQSRTSSMTKRPASGKRPIALKPHAPSRSANSRTDCVSYLLCGVAHLATSLNFTTLNGFPGPVIIRLGRLREDMPTRPRSAVDPRTRRGMASPGPSRGPEAVCGP
jgi:hypothetical protein